MRVSIIGFNEDALKGAVNDALHERANDLPADLDRSTALKGSQDLASGTQEVQRIARRHGLDLHRESADDCRPTPVGEATCSVSVDGLL